MRDPGKEVAITRVYFVPDNNALLNFQNSGFVFEERYREDDCSRMVRINIWDYIFALVNTRLI